MSACLTAFIFARGGSKGLPNKNVRLFLGKPLIAWAIENALKATDVGRVIVSTDDPYIADIGNSFGAEVPFLRPHDLASDTASEWDAWRHALETVHQIEGSLPEPFISVPSTAPLRIPEDIDACISAYREGNADAIVTVTEAHRNPWFNMVVEKQDGTVTPVIRTAESIARRQDAPKVFDITTVAYVANSEFVLTNQEIFSGRVKAVHIPTERSIDIDTLHDFSVAEFLMKRRLEER